MLAIFSVLCSIYDLFILYMAVFLKEEEQRDADIQKECHVTEAEAEVTQLKAKKYQRLRAAIGGQESQENPLLERPSRRAWPCLHLDFRLLISRAIRLQISIVSI